MIRRDQVARKVYVGSPFEGARPRFNGLNVFASDKNEVSLSGRSRLFRSTTPALMMVVQGISWQ